MDGRLFSFIATSISVLLWHSLPPLVILPIIFTVAILLCKFTAKHSPGQLIAWGLWGILWLTSVGHWQRSLQLPLGQLTKPVIILGQVDSLIHSRDQVRFTLKLAQSGQKKHWWQPRIRVTWAEPAWQLKQGQQVKLMVKLKPPNGLANEGGFDYQKWLFSQGIVATGYVKTSLDNQLLNNAISYRQTLLDRLSAYQFASTPWIAALTLGDRGLLEPSDWSLVQRTGIAHLIAISGLHLSLVASLSYALVSFCLQGLFSLFCGAQKINFHRLGLLGALVATLGYAVLAGLGLPTVRAWLMLTLVTLVIVTNRHWRARRLLLVSVFIFIVIFPLSLFSQSFWLSFSAVLIIWFVFWRWPLKQAEFSIGTFVVVLCRIQLALSVLMLPLVAWQFSFVSLASPVVNLVAVPLVTLLLVPLCLFGGVLSAFAPTLAYWPFYVANEIIQTCLGALNTLAQWPWSALNIQAIPGPVWAMTTLGVLTVLLPRGLFAKKVAVLLFLPLLTFYVPRDKQFWQVDVLDVGQGLSVMISKDNQTLLYDVGAAYPSGFNMAEAVILPLLQARGTDQISTLFISHFDNDHSGSLPVLLSNVRVKKVITSFNLCQQGWQLAWHGLTITALWPDDPDKHNDNNGSCVLLIDDGRHRVLLTGDIDADIERRLVNQYGQNLQADILLAAHHGSNSSSSAEFIAAVGARHVVFSQGFMNRWRFPRREVVLRFMSSRRTLYSTSETGQISFLLPQSDTGAIKVSTFRQDISPYWYGNY
ncbi:MAG: competence protein ComEC [Paraglaciecola sp.]|jgi:competence protein ComEC